MAEQQKDDVTRAPESGQPVTDRAVPTPVNKPANPGPGPVSPGQAKVGEDYESGNPAPK